MCYMFKSMTCSFGILFHRPVTFILLVKDHRIMAHHAARQDHCRAGAVDCMAALTQRRPPILQGRSNNHIKRRERPNGRDWERGGGGRRREQSRAAQRRAEGPPGQERCRSRLLASRIRKRRN